VDTLPAAINEKIYYDAIMQFEEQVLFKNGYPADITTVNRGVDYEITHDDTLTGRNI